MAKPTAVAMATSRASRQPLFVNSQRHRITHIVEINIPAGTSNEPDTSPTVRTGTAILARRRSTGSAAQVLA